MKLNLIIIALSIFVSCNQHHKENMEQWKQEVVEAELNFSKMAEKKGIPEAFLAFASDSAVLLRGQTLIEGKNEMETYFLKNSNTSPDNNLDWAPDFVDVSSSGDLAYTYGKYTFTTKDSLGNKVVNTGIFHTVWKRQPDGEWKFVWD